MTVVAWALYACSLDFDIAGRQFECPLELTRCLECNPDGTCRVEATVAPNEPLPVPPAPDGPKPPVHVPDAGNATDAGTAEPPPAQRPDAAPNEPTGPLVPGECDEFDARTSDSLCLNGNERCFSLGNVLGPALALWLDPTTLPREGARSWCDRSGNGHHALLMPEGEAPRVEEDLRTVGDDLGRSIELDGGWLLLKGAAEVLRPGNFAVLLAAAAPLAASDRGRPVLFESGDGSAISLSIDPDTGTATGRISSDETSLVTDPVVTRSSVYDGRFHLYTLYRRSVRVLDDVLQLRLNGVLEFRGSSIAIPRGLDLSSSAGPRFGGSSTAEDEAPTGRERLAAIVILRGSLPEDELARLENFLCESLAVCEAPGPPLGVDPEPLDGGS